MVSIEKRRWQSHVRSQARCGLSQAAYCRIYGIPLPEFVRWRRQSWAAVVQPLHWLPVVAERRAR